MEAFLSRPTVGGFRRAPATFNQELAALRAFARFAQANLDWADDPTAGIAFRRVPAQDPAVLTASELRRLFLAASRIPNPQGIALALAILALLGQVGLRVHELVALDLDQVDLGSGTLVGVHGKGGTVHDLPLNAPTIALVTAWLGARTAVAAPKEPALFVSSRSTRISVRAIQRLLERLRKAIGSAKHITPHTLRHTTATLALTMGSDLSTVADLLRHTDLNTTRRYLHLVDERRREAVRRLGSCIPEELLPTSADTEPSVRASAPPVDLTADSPRSTVGYVPRGSTDLGAVSLDAQYGLDDIGEAA